jgi:lipopolysaccharide transport system permease protein
MKTQVTIIILNWNGKADTLECLASVYQLDYPNFEVIVVDNGSTDGSSGAIRKAFPKVTLIENGANLGFAIASTIFIAMMVFYQVPLTASMGFILILLPLQVLFTAAAVFFLSATNVYFRDVRYAVPFIIQLWLYATPIAFSMEVVPERFRLLYVIVNPLAGLIDSFRSIVLHGRPPVLAHLVIVATVSVGLFLGSYVFFKRLERNFADVI